MTVGVAGEVLGILAGELDVIGDVIGDALT
jgi:hypothetical protein